MIENTWKTQNTIVSGSAFKNRLIWANGDTTGYGFHADFTNGKQVTYWDGMASMTDLCVPSPSGWNTEVLTKALNDPHCLLNKSM